MNHPLPLIYDCDPGLDDAIALLMILASSKELNLLGVTTVVGNGTVYQNQENARRICEVAQRPDIKVFQGCPRTFFAKMSSSDSTYTAADIHGETGLGGLKLPFPSLPLQSLHAVSYLVKTLMEAEDKITIAATAALTNISCALIMEPRIKDKIEKIVIMGGAIGVGNITPAAEFNFYCDPHAAHVVFTSGIPTVLIPLDATRQTQTSEAWLEDVQAIESDVSQAVVDMLSYYHRPDAILEPEATAGVLHDPNVIAYLLDSSLYQGRDVYVEIDTSHTNMAGRSTVDWYAKLHEKPNAYVINKVNVEGFFHLLTERLKRYPSKEGGAL